ncbi:MAG: hypothetical protein K2O78_08995 [Muribaculaceae bacterium]|nr:hypothetical protein [Muribaculaceae bacterium]
MTAIVIILALIAIWLIFAPYIRPWLQRRAEQKLADYLRRQMGMPTEKEQRKAEKEARRQQNARYGTWSAPDPRRRADARRRPNEPIIPREYAVDVEYTEIREFSQTIIRTQDSKSGSRVDFKVENQVSDVEYTEIKQSNATR